MEGFNTKRELLKLVLLSRADNPKFDPDAVIRDGHLHLYLTPEELEWYYKYEADSNRFNW